MSLRQVTVAAERARIVYVPNDAVRELYGTIEMVVDETATLRRVALLYRGTGRYRFTPEERLCALGVIRQRDG